MAAFRSIARMMIILAVIAIAGTFVASFVTLNPEWFVAGVGVAVFLATVAVLWLTEPLVDSSEALVKSYDNLRFIENKRDSIEEARIRHRAWTSIANFVLNTEDIPGFLAQGSFIVGDPWLLDYRAVCELLEGINPGLDQSKILVLTNDKARQRKVEFERILEHLQQRPASSFPEVEDLRNPDAYMERHKMFPYDRRGAEHR